MTDTEKKIAEIREALEKATPGPWKVKKGERWTEDYPRETYIQAVWDKPDHRGCVGYRVAKMSGVHGKTMRDAYLIANAPEWLRFLLSELEKRDEENQKLRKELDKQVEIGFSFECQLQSAQQEIERLKHERAKLAEFAREIIKGVWDGGDWGGAEVQELAEKYGLIEPVPYDPEKHGDDYLAMMEPGDTLYVFTDILKTW